MASTPATNPLVEYSKHSDHERQIEKEILNRDRLAATLRDLLKGAGAAPTTTETRQWAFDNSVSIDLHRRDVLPLYDHQWLQQGIVEGIITSHFPHHNIGGGCQIVNSTTITTHLECRDTEDLLNGIYGPAPFDLTDDVKELIIVLNEERLHWVTVQVDRTTSVIRVFDSYISEDELEQQLRVTYLGDRLKPLFNTYCSFLIFSGSWTACIGL